MGGMVVGGESRERGLRSDKRRRVGGTKFKKGQIQDKEKEERKQCRSPFLIRGGEDSNIPGSIIKGTLSRGEKAKGGADPRKGKRTPRYGPSIPSPKF